MTHITPNQQNTHFRLCTFNLLNYNAPPNACYETDNIYTNEQWQRKERWIDLYLGLMQGDVVGFQEVFSPESLADLTRKQGYDHFATVEKPRKGRDHIYHKPVVAIASRFPILSCKTINLSKTSKIKSGLSSQFRFSRAPLKAEVFIENFGQCLVYVVHLKSSRPSLEPPLFKQSESWQKVAAQSMLRQAQGYWNSLKQRGNEAMLLYQDVVREVLKRDQPVVLLGDFNTSINAETLRQLVEAREIRELNKTPRQSLNVEAQRQIRRFSLYDAFDLQNKVGVDARKNTHYFLNRGSVLDYVLLSKDFDQAYDHSLASVVSYEVFDRHLQNPEYAIDSQCSDHAPVVVELEVRQ